MNFNWNSKQWIGVVAVSVVSSSLTLGAYQLFDGGASIRFDKETFSAPVSFTGSLPMQSAIETDFTKAAEAAVHAVVHIKSTQQGQLRQGSRNPIFDFWFGDQAPMIQTPPRIGMGSGVIISPDGYIVTNNHVIANADEIEVTLNDKRALKARLVGADPNTDIALIKVDAEDLSTVVFGNSDDLKVGEWVLAVGNPFNLTSTVTAGIVSAKARNVDILRNAGNMKIESFIQTDAAVNPGNSGGALVNTRGELIGINTAIASETGSFTGYSFAVPASIVSKVVTDLRQFGTVQRAMLGVGLVDINAASATKFKIKVQDGAYVAEVFDQGAAKDAGIENGDVINEINGIRVKTMAELQEQVGRYRPGDKIRIGVNRSGSQREFAATLKNMVGTTEMLKNATISSLGAKFKPLSRELMRSLGVNYGVQITEIVPGRKLDQAGVKQSFVILKINDTPIRKAEDIEAIMNKIANQLDREAGLFIVGAYPNGRMGYYAVDISDHKE